MVHPFLLELAEEVPMRLDWEHTECKWVRPDERGELDTVPLLRETWRQLWKT